MTGTPAAPKPYASRLRFVSNEQLAATARAAGFDEVTVEQPDLRPAARRHGFEGDVLSVFAPEMGQLLVALKR
jgi:hypothetical protein